jgi:enterochelin esterase-like enzyme
MTGGALALVLVAAGTARGGASHGAEPGTSRAAVTAARVTTAVSARSPGLPTISPVVGDPVSTGDGFYVFSLQAPSAKAVSVTGSWGLSYTQATYPMTEANGTWTVLLGPLTPGIYSYSFIVDGTATKDPDNANSVHSSPALSTFLVPGPSAGFLTPHTGPHGALSVLSYHSAVTGTERYATVWTPPGYSAAAGQPYPVLYLVHGGGGDYLDWIDQGDANVILDNLYRERKIKPMVVVMPDGNVPGSTGLPQDDTFPKELLGSLVPAVQKTYRVSSSPSGRALAGLSLGGLQTFNTLLDDPGAFAYVGDFSSGYFPAIIDELKASDGALLANPAINARTKLLRIYIGNQMDIAYTNNIATRQLFDQYGIRYQFAGVYAPSDHDWKTWQYDLHDFAPRLFGGR